MSTPESIALRDFFAAMSLQGMIGNSSNQGQFDTNIYAQIAYEMADAMVRAREIKFTAEDSPAAEETAVGG